MKRKTFLLWMLALWAGISVMSAYDAEVNGIYYNFISGTTASVTYLDNNYNSYSGDVVIPSTVTSGGVTYSVTQIGNYAFRDCGGLTSVTIPESVIGIRRAAFYNCSGLTSITFPSGLIGFDAEAFYGCTGLASITIPNSVTKIGDSAFYGCTGLTSVTIPESVTTIGERAFLGCSMASVTIPNSVTLIGPWTFGLCIRLTSVTIGESVTGIQNNAFAGCYSLTSVISQVQEPFKMADTFFGLNPAEYPSNCLLKVPVGTRDAYIAKGWTTDKFQGGIVEYCIEAIDAEGNTVMQFLDYVDDKHNTVTLMDTYQSLTVPTVPQDIPLKQISYVRNFGNTSWQSLYVPFEIPVTAQLLEEFEFAYINGAKQYDDNDDGVADRLTIESFKVKSGTLRANNPYIIRAKTTGEKTITVNEATLYATAANSIDCSTTTLLFTFQGSYTKLNYEDMVDCYLLGGGTWNPTASGNTMKPMRFYLKVTSRGNNQVITSAPTIRLQIDGEMTDIDTPFNEDDFQIVNSNSSNSKCFDLQGRPVENPGKGIYIINGKKTIVR